MRPVCRDAKKIWKIIRINLGLITALDLQYAFVCVPLMPSRSGRSPLEEPSESNFLAVPRDLSFHEFLRERQSYAIFHSTYSVCYHLQVPGNIDRLVATINKHYGNREFNGRLKAIPVIFLWNKVRL